jgi:predicted SnoaL-like aldol condensation-catalyzing enzyme
MSFTLTSILPDFFWRKTNNAHNPVGGIAPPPWDAHLKLSFMDEAGIDVAVTSIPTPGVHVGDDGRSGIVARDSLATRNFTVQRAFMVVAVIASSIAILFAPAFAQSQDRSVMTTDALGASARQAMIDIFRKKDPTAVDRYFAESFIQHDPNLADGRAGMKSFVEEVASSSAADITIYRTLVDGALVLLHSRYQGVSRHGQNAIAFDLFRFSGGKIAEHWGGREPEEPPNASGRTQVGGPTDIVDRERRRPTGR